jgi:hypothetical protein
MAIATEADYKGRRDAPWQRILLEKSAITTVAAKPYSTWLAGGFPAAGSAPTTAAVPTNATAGSFGQYDSTGTLRLLRSQLSWDLSRARS